MESLKSPVDRSRREGAAGTKSRVLPKANTEALFPVGFCFCLIPLGNREWLLIHQKDWELQRGEGGAGALLSKYFKEPQGLREVAWSETVYQTKLISSHFIFCSAPAI